MTNIEALAKWTAPKEVQTKYGPRILRTAAVTPEFSAAWRTEKEALKAQGASFSKDRNGEWQLSWWQQLTAETVAARVESVEASRAVSAEIDLPRPDGLDYMPFQKAGIRFGLMHPNVLIGDEMGLGKTIQAIGMINADLAIDTVLVICPKSLKLNWYKELRKWLVRPLTVGVVNARWPDTNVVIMNYEALGKWQELTGKRTWGACIVDECFPYGTQVQTNQGSMSIGDIVENKLNVSVASFDLSCNALQYKHITGYVKKPINHRLVMIKHELGEIVCTENHMIWTEGGYVKAGEIKSGTRVLVLPQEIYDREPGQGNGEILLSQSCFLLEQYITSSEESAQPGYEHGDQDLRLVPQRVQFQDDGSREQKAQILWKSMRGGVENGSTGAQGNSERVGERARGWKPTGYNPTRCSRENADYEQRSSYQGADRSGCCEVEGGASNILDAGWQRSTDDTSIETSRGTGLGYGSCNIDGTRERSISELTPMLQSGLRKHGIESGRGSGWENTQTEAVEVFRSAQGSGVIGAGVVCVEVLERNRYGEFGCGVNGDQYVYCLEVEDNHNFFADGVLVSNCHLIKNKKTQRSVNVKAIKSVRKMRLTGTPIVNRPAELWNIIEDLAPEQFGNFFAFAKRYAGAANNGFGWEFKGATNLDELQRRLRETVMVRRLKADVLTELPRKIRQIIEIEAETPEQRACVRRESQYEDESDDRLAGLRVAVELAKAEGEDAYKAAVTALREASQIDFTEMAKLRHDTAVAKAGAVIAHVAQCLEDNDNKIVVACHHHDVAVELMKGLFDYGPVLLMGGMSEEERQRSVDTFQTNKRCRVFVGGIQAAGVGITLTASAQVVFAELDWVPGNVSQMEDRCHRIGQTETVLIQHIVLGESIDSRMAKILVEKQEVIDKALDVLHPDRVQPVYTPKKQAATQGVTVTELDKVAATLTPEMIAEIHGKLRYIASDDMDRAAELNSVGFNKIDSLIGNDLAGRPWLSPKQAAIGVRLVTKYARQCGKLSWLQDAK